MLKDKEKIKKQLWGELNSLRNEKYGFIEAGSPRFNRLFGRDSLITAWQILDFEPKVAKNTLEILIRFQGKEICPEKDEEPGKIIHEHQIGKKRHPDGHFPFPYYGSVDSTPLFLILFSLYYKKSKDKDFLKKYWSNVLMALHWFFHFGDKNGDYFLEYKRKRKTGLFHQAWKDGFENHLNIKLPVVMVEVQGYQYLALIEIAKLAGEIFQDKELKNSLLGRAKELKKIFNQKFWLKKEKYFAFTLDGNKKPVKKITSNPGHLLFTGIVDSKQKEKAIIKKLFSSELWTPFGIRTYSIKETDFDPLSYHLGSVWPHDNWLIAQGLKKLGYKKEYQEIKKALLRAYQEIGFLPELYGVIDNKITLKTKITPCYPQAWASGALLNLLAD